MAARNGSDVATAGVSSIERASDRELVISRTFNGPARIVFEAWTRADLVRRWWAPRSLGGGAVHFEADVRVGGRYRYVIRPEGHEAFAFSGEYLEVTPHVRLVYTAFYEPGAVAPSAGTPPVIITVTFEERGERTHLVSREVYPSKEVLDMAIATGMERGLRVALDQLDELVASLGSE